MRSVDPFILRHRPNLRTACIGRCSIAIGNNLLNPCCGHHSLVIGKWAADSEQFHHVRPPVILQIACIGLLVRPTLMRATRLLECRRRSLLRSALEGEAPSSRLAGAWNDPGNSMSFHFIGQQCPTGSSSSDGSKGKSPDTDRLYNFFPLLRKKTTAGDGCDIFEASNSTCVWHCW